MSLRGQTIVFLGGTILVLFAAAAMLSFLVFRPDFARLERDDAVRDLRGVSDLLEAEIDGLRNAAMDWAVWDQSYAYLLGADSAFAAREITPGALTRLAIDQMLFFSPSGDPVLSVGSTGGRLVPFDAAMEPAWMTGGVLSGLAAAGADTAGLVVIGDRMALAAVHDVLASDGDGPRAGSLAFVRLLDSSDGLARVLSSSALDAWISRPDSAMMPGDTLFTYPNDDELIVSVSHPSLDGGCVRLHTRLNRDIAAEADTILTHFIALTVLGGIIFSIVTLSLIQFLVVKRIRGIMAMIQESGASPEQTGTERLDEVSSIGLAIGPVLEKLETLTGAIRRSEQNNAMLLRLIPDFMVRIRRDGTIVSVKPGYGFKAPLPLSRAEGMHIDDIELIDAEASRIKSIISRVLDRNTVESISLGVRSQETTYYLDVRIVAFGPDTVLAVARDVTQKMKAEEAASRLQRLESLGLLAGGIAHDFNNRLSTAIGSIELAMSDIPNPSQQVLRSLERALDACVRAGDLTRKLLTFSTGGSPYFKPTDVEDLAKTVLGPLFRGLGISLRLDIRPGTWPIDADEDQIAQLFRNMATNSIEAIGGYGWFEMKAYNSIDPQVAGLNPGHYVTMEFLDSGPGIREDLLKKVFEPYFTTKDESVGLGLSMAHSIAVKHAGWLEALPGPGGRFVLHIPAIHGMTDPSQYLPASAMGGRARILVMDDDLSVLETIKEMLETLDYTVETAADGGAALYRLAEAVRKGRPFDILILDLVVPGGIGGLETLARARARFGDVHAIVSSGYSSDSVLSEYAVHGFKAALRKPFNLEELSSTVRRLLASIDQDGAGPSGRQGGMDP